MVFKTRVTELLGVEYPLIQGGMYGVSRAELVSAVSNAGGLGILHAFTCGDPEGLVEEIRRTRGMTDKPFGVNVTLLPTYEDRDIEAFFDVALSEGIRIFETAGSNPEPWMKKLKEAGAIVMHKCPSLRFARKAEEVGCDAVILNGFEGAGHPGEDEVSSLVLIRAAVEVLRVPVIAAGGFGDGRGLLAAFALGAEGVLLGTRFMATKEAPVHPKVKEALIRATQRDTVLIERSLRRPLRILKNKHAERILELERQGATFDQLKSLIKGEFSKKALQEGDTEGGLIVCGQIVATIKDIPLVEELIRRMIEEFKRTLAYLNSLLL